MLLLLLLRVTTTWFVMADVFEALSASFSSPFSGGWSRVQVVVIIVAWSMRWLCDWEGGRRIEGRDLIGRSNTVGLHQQGRVAHFIRHNNNKAATHTST